MNFIWWKIKNSKRLLFWFLNQNINLDHSANWILEKTLKCLMWHYLNIILHDFVQHVTWDFPGIHFGFTNLTSTSKLQLSIIVPFFLLVDANVLVCSQREDVKCSLCGRCKWQFVCLCMRERFGVWCRKRSWNNFVFSCILLDYG